MKERIRGVAHRVGDASLRRAIDLRVDDIVVRR